MRIGKKADVHRAGKLDTPSTRPKAHALLRRSEADNEEDPTSGRNGHNGHDCEGHDEDSQMQYFNDAPPTSSTLGDALAAKGMRII